MEHPRGTVDVPRREIARAGDEMWEPHVCVSRDGVAKSERERETGRVDILGWVDTADLHTRVAPMENRVAASLRDDLPHENIHSVVKVIDLNTDISINFQLHTSADEFEWKRT